MIALRAPASSNARSPVPHRHRVTDPPDLPEHKSTYAMRDVAAPAAAARHHDDAVGV